MPFLIDHLMSVTTERERAARALTNMGFRLTERGEHPGRGTSNHLMFFGPCYWEILCVDEPRDNNRPLLEAIADGPGLVGVALRTHGLDRDIAGLRADGRRVSDPEAFTRPLSDTGPIARFRTARVDAAADCSAYVFFCEHLTPQFVWPAEDAAHPNGARRLKALHILGPTQDKAAAAVGPLLRTGDADEPSIVAHGLDQTPAQRMGLTPRLADDRARLWALEFAVDDLAASQAWLAQAGIRHERRGDAVVAFADGLGEQPLIFSA